MREPKRIVVTGASGNVGSGVLKALSRRHPDAEVIGVCRRPPAAGQLFASVRWHAVDLAASDAVELLAPVMVGADVVIHLALALYPVDDTAYLYRANVVGTEAVLRAMTAANVGQLVYASSLGVYGPGPDRPVPETWPASGQPGSTYSKHKVMVEALLDQYEREHPDLVVSRFRPTVVVQRAAASMVRTLYLGPWVPRPLLRLLAHRALPVMPLPKGLARQFVHADDVGDAAVCLMSHNSRGSFNVAADVLDARALADLVGARPLEVDAKVARRTVRSLHRLGLVAVTPGWYDVATKTPLMDTTKLRRETGWAPTRTSADSARELIGGLADGAVGESAALGSKDGGGHVQTESTTGRVHDASLALWIALSLTWAIGERRPGPADAAVIATNLVAGAPAALDRMRQRRRDPVALLAPAAVSAAVLTSRRGGWPAVAATAVLGTLAVAERRRVRR